MNRKLVLIPIIYLFFVSSALAAGFFENDVPFRIGVSDNTAQPKYQFKFNLTDLEGVDQIANIKMYKANTQNIINSFEVNGNITTSCNDSPIDLEINFDDSNLNILTRNLSVAVLNATTSNLILDIVTPEISDLMVYRAYEVHLPANFNFKNIDLKIKYGDLPVDDETKIVLKRCGNFDLNTSLCLENWTDVNKNIDTTNKQIFATITSFSVYALGEYQDNETPTTTTTTTSTSTTTPTTATPTTTTTPSGGTTGTTGGGDGGTTGSNTRTTTTTSSTSTTSPTTTTTLTIITAAPTNTTTQTNTTAKQSDYFTGMSTFIQQNSVYFAIPIVAVAGFLLWKFYLSKRKATAPRFYKVSGRLPKKNKSYSRKETRLVLG